MVQISEVHILNTACVLKILMNLIGLKVRTPTEDFVKNLII